MKPTIKITFLPYIGNPDIISFVVDCSESDSFCNVIKRAIKMLKTLDPSIRRDIYQITTNSADISIKTEEYRLPLSEIITKYGRVFCIKSPFIL